MRFEFLLPKKEIRARAQQGRLVFVLAHGGLIEWLILSSWCRTQALGAILISNRRWILLFAKPKFFLQRLFRRRTYGDLFADQSEMGPRLLFVSGRERRELFVSTPSEKVLAHLYSALGAQASMWTLIPVYVLWRKHVPGETRKLSEYLLGLSSNPNMFGKLWYLLRRRTDSTIRCLGVFSLHSSESDESVDMWADSAASRFARSTRRKMLILETQERRVLLGPRYHSPTSVKDSLLRDAEIQSVIQQHAEELGIDSRRAMSGAYRLLTEIVANYKIRCVEILYVLLHWLFSKVFDGISYREEELQRVRELMKVKPVVFIPCHRSHLDYLVIPYLLFANDIVTPHIAAGINLSFWPVGRYLRMAGAFFIRRSFRGDKLYSILLRKYVEYLLKNRFNIKFFIEGTRSRSGKMLPPAYGLLKMVSEAQQSLAVEDVSVIPVAICYDEVPEQGVYSEELGGADKQRESTGALIRASRILKRRFGKVYVRLAPSVSLAEQLNNGGTRPADSSLALQKTAFRICKAINDATPITAKSLVSTIFLTHRSASLSFEQVRHLTRYLVSYVEAVGGELSASTPKELDRAVERTVRKLHRSGVLAVVDDLPRSYVCEGKKRNLINFYKNNSAHHFARASIVLLAFFYAVKSEEEDPKVTFYDKFISAVLRLKDLLKFEFFFSPTQVFVEQVARDCRFFFGEASWDRRPIKDWIVGLEQRTGSWNDLSIYLNLLGDLMEGYISVAFFFLDTKDLSWERKTLIQKLLKSSQAKLQRSELIFPESISIQTYTNALSFFENQNLLRVDKATSRTVVTKTVDPSGFADLIEEIRRFTDLLVEKPETLVHPEVRL